MKLYNMLDKAHYCTKVAIYAETKQEDMIFRFIGEVEEATHDECVWGHLMEKVDRFEVYRGVLIITVATKEKFVTLGRPAPDLNEHQRVDRWLDGGN